MKLVNLYHLVGVGVLALVALSFSLGFNESATILGIGVIVVLVLGIHLVLDKINENLYYHEKKLIELSNSVDSIKASVEIIGGLSNNGIVLTTSSLEGIRDTINKLNEDVKELSNILKN